MSALAEVLDTLADLAEFAGKALGMTAPVGIIVNGAAIALRGADGVVRAIERDELERLRVEFESQRAGSEAAWRASHQDFHRGEE